jgi:hypothetical protein
MQYCWWWSLREWYSIVQLHRGVGEVTAYRSDLPLRCIDSGLGFSIRKTDSRADTDTHTTTTRTPSLDHTSSTNNNSNNKTAEMERGTLLAAEVLGLSPGTLSLLNPVYLHTFADNPAWETLDELRVRLVTDREDYPMGFQEEILATIWGREMADEVVEEEDEEEEDDEDEDEDEEMEDEEMEDEEMDDEEVVSEDEMEVEDEEMEFGWGATGDDQHSDDDDVGGGATAAVVLDLRED